MKRTVLFISSSSPRIKGKWSLYLKLCFWNAFHITDFTKMERWIHSLGVSKNVSAKCAWLLSHAKWPRASQASQAGIFGGWEYPGDMCMLVCKYVGLSFGKKGGWKSVQCCFTSLFVIVWFSQKRIWSRFFPQMWCLGDCTLLQSPFCLWCLSACCVPVPQRWEVLSKQAAGALYHNKMPNPGALKSFCCYRKLFVDLFRLRLWINTSLLLSACFI